MPGVYGLHPALRNGGITGLPARQCCKCEPARSSAHSARLEANRRALPERVAARNDAIDRPPRGRCNCDSGHSPVHSARLEARRLAMLELIAGRTSAIARPLGKSWALPANRSSADTRQDLVQPEGSWVHMHSGLTLKYGNRTDHRDSKGSKSSLDSRNRRDSTNSQDIPNLRHSHNMVQASKPMAPNLTRSHSPNHPIRGHNPSHRNLLDILRNRRGSRLRHNHHESLLHRRRGNHHHRRHGNPHLHLCRLHRRRVPRHHGPSHWCRRQSKQLPRTIKRYAIYAYAPPTRKRSTLYGSIQATQLARPSGANLMSRCVYYATSSDTVFDATCGKNGRTREVRQSAHHLLD